MIKRSGTAYHVKSNVGLAQEALLHRELATVAALLKRCAELEADLRNIKLRIGRAELAIAGLTAQTINAPTIPCCSRWR